MDWGIILPSIKSLLTNPPPLSVWLNLIKYKFTSIYRKKNVSHFPLSLVIYATKRCNFNCEFCFTYSELNKPDWQNDELTLEKFKKILFSEAGRKSLRVGFLGGEPFLNSNLFDFIKMSHDQGKITTVVTNASIINDVILNKLLNNFPTFLGISLYDNNKEQVALLCDSLNKKGKKYWVQSVVSSDELINIESKIEFAKQNGIRNLILSNYHPTRTGEIKKTIFDDNVSFHQYAQKAYKLAKKYKINLTLPAPVQRRFKNRNCQMLFSYLHVDSNGNVGPCCFRAPNKKYGNLLEGLDWNSSEFLSLRNPFIDHSLEPQSECKFCENFGRDLYGV